MKPDISGICGMWKRIVYSSFPMRLYLEYYIRVHVDWISVDFFFAASSIVWTLTGETMTSVWFIVRYIAVFFLFKHLINMNELMNLFGVLN